MTDYITAQMKKETEVMCYCRHRGYIQQLEIKQELKVCSCRGLIQVSMRRFPSNFFCIVQNKKWA